MDKSDPLSSQYRDEKVFIIIIFFSSHLFRSFQWNDHAVQFEFCHVSLHSIRQVFSDLCMQFFFFFLWLSHKSYYLLFLIDLKKWGWKSRRVVEVVIQILNVEQFQEVKIMLGVLSQSIDHAILSVATWPWR